MAGTLVVGELEEMLVEPVRMSSLVAGSKTAEAIVTLSRTLASLGRVRLSCRLSPARAQRPNRTSEQKKLGKR